MKKRIASDEGFTLVELMVVVLIIAVLIAFGLVSFLGARRAAQDRAAQSLAREALASAKTLFQSDEDYTAATVTNLRAAEPAIDFVAGTVPSTGPDEVSVDSPDSVTFVAAVYAKTGTCFWIRDRAVPTSGGTDYAEADVDSSACVADPAPADSSFDDAW